MVMMSARGGREDGMTGFCGGSLVLVRARGIVGHVGDDWWDRRICGIRIWVGREEWIDAARAGTKKEVHCGGSWRAVGLRAATHVENQGDDGFQVGNSLDGRGPVGESPLHVCQGGSRGGGHGKQLDANKMGLKLPLMEV